MAIKYHFYGTPDFAVQILAKFIIQNIRYYMFILNHQKKKSRSEN